MTANKNLPNYCFIDGQNLHYSVKEAADPWKIDYKKLRTYLRDKYRVAKAYYFIGHKQDKFANLYRYLQNSGYIVMFRPHSEWLVSEKKGNVDTDVIFEIMKKLLDEPDEFDKIVLITGDGDFKKVVEYLADKNRLAKLMFPNKKRFSSLYKNLHKHHKENLSHPSVKSKVEYKR